MLGAPPELASDLDWMLLSDQAGDGLLAGALSVEFFPSLYHLALACLGQPDFARQLAVETLTGALLDRERYASGRWRQEFPAGRQAAGDLDGRGARLWVFSLALRRLDPRWPRKSPHFFHKPGETGAAGTDAALGGVEIRSVWKAFAALPETDRLGVCLHALLGWPAEDIAALLGVGSIQVQAVLDRLPNLASQAAGSGEEPGSPAATPALASLLADRWPAPQFQAADLERVVVDIGAQVQRRALSRLRASRSKETVWVGLAAALIALVLWGANRLLPEPEVGSATLPTATARPSLPTSPPGPAAQPGEVDPLPDPNTAPRPDLYRVLPGDTLAGIAQKLNTTLSDLVSLNRLLPSAGVQAGQILVAPNSLAKLGLPVPTPVSPRAPGPALPAGAGVQQVEAWQASASGNYSTLWVEARALDYGPPGYIGPPQVARIQAWLSRDQMLLVYGEPQGQPLQILLATRQRVYRARPATQPGWFFPVHGETSLSPELVQNLGLLLRALHFHLASDRGLDWQIVDREKVAGREALVLAGAAGEETGRQRVWLDTHTGLALRLQQYDDRAPDTLLQEVVLSHVTYDANFPPELFDPRLPWRGGYARNAAGEPLPDPSGEANPLDRLAAPWPLPEGHQPLLYLSPPPGFDPSGSQLAFQFSSGFNNQSPQTGVDLFAGGYFLGSLPFGNPWSLACTRSADGLRLAYVSQPVRAPRKNAALYWLDLRNPEHVQRPLGGAAVTQFAFSPDSRSLAAFGYDDQLSIGAIYRVDLASGRSQPLIYLQEVRSLAWGPEGDTLLVSGVRQALTGLENLVVDANTGELAGTFSAGDPHFGLLKTGFPRPVGALRNCVFSPLAN